MKTASEEKILVAPPLSSTSVKERKPLLFPQRDRNEFLHLRWEERVVLSMLHFRLSAAVSVTLALLCFKLITNLPTHGSC